MDFDIPQKMKRVFSMYFRLVIRKPYRISFLQRTLTKEEYENGIRAYLFKINITDYTIEEKEQ